MLGLTITQAFVVGLVLGTALGLLVARAMRHDSDDDLLGGC